MPDRPGLSSVRTRVDSGVFAAFESKAALAGQSVAARLRELIEADAGLSASPEEARGLALAQFKKWLAAAKPPGAPAGLGWLNMIDRAVRRRIGDALPEPGSTWASRLEWAHVVDPYLRQARGKDKPLPDLPEEGSL